MMNNFAIQTQIFTVVIFILIAFSARLKTSREIFPKNLTEELKGLAILGVIFAHIGYGLYQGTNFLFPLSVWAGVSVNAFFFLSGLGLVLAELKKKQALEKPDSNWSNSLKLKCQRVAVFYRRRLVKIIVPLWLSLLIFILADYLILGRTYSFTETWQSFLGFFPNADFYLSINSPLWFLTPLLYFYFVFPWLFSRRRPRLSIVGLFAAASLLQLSFLPVSEQIHGFYLTHWLAFPLGALLGVIISSADCQSSWLMKLFTVKNKKTNQLKQLSGQALSYLIMVVLALIAYYLSLHAGLNAAPWKQQTISLMTLAAVVLLMRLLPLRFRLLELFGVYSFSIYLLHWPLLSRYDLLFNYLPLSLAVLVWLGLLLGLAWLFNRLTDYLEKPLLPKKY